MLALAILAAGLPGAVTARQHPNREPVRGSGPGAAPGPGPGGIYVYAEQPASSQEQLAQAVAVPGVDGMAAVVDWSAIEPNRSSAAWRVAAAGTADDASDEGPFRGRAAAAVVRILDVTLPSATAPRRGR